MRRIVTILSLTVATGFGSATRDGQHAAPVTQSPGDADEIALGAALAAQFDADRGVARAHNRSGSKRICNQSRIR